MARFFTNFDYKRAQEYTKSVLNILCVTKFVTSSLAAFVSCDMGKINASDKIMSKTRKKRKYGNKRYFYIKLHLKDCFFGMEFTGF